VDLLTTEIGRRVGTTFDVLSWVPDALRAPASLWDQFREGAAAMGEALAAGLRSTSETPLNQPLGPHRRFDWLEMDLAEVKFVKDSLGGTVNDVVLATVAGALRRFLKLRRLEVDDLVIRANVPVSIRRRDQRGTLGNRIALFMPELPVAEAEPVERLARVREAMARLKESRQAVGADVLAAVSEWTSATLLSLAVRVATRGRPYNLVVTNVPGPQLPLYLLGARMDTCYPVVNLLENQALGVALFSYDQRLYWGFTADWELLPDLHEFVRAIEISFQELRSAAQAASGARQTEPPGAQAPEAS
jgi:WS/DGAT/MGAT family acyltransferase